MSLYKIRLTIDLIVESEKIEDPQFYFEEHRCRDDFIEQAYKEVQEATENGTCLCYRTSVKYLGPA